MAKTNSGLAKYVKLQVGLPYWFGTFGQKGSAQLYAAKKKQYPKYYTAKDFSKQYGKRVHDCAGLIKGYLWSATPTSTPVYKASQDFGATGFYTHAKRKGTISSFPKYNGLLVFKGKNQTMTHVGVYADGMIVEAKGHAYGVVKTKFKPSEWTHWAQCHLITDDIHPTPAPAPAPTPEPLPDPTPEPAPTPTPPAPKPTTQKYKVKTNGSPLALRVAPKKKAALILWIPNGKTVTVSSMVNGDDVYGCKDWARATYNGRTGYCSAKYLKKV